MVERPHGLSPASALSWACDPRSSILPLLSLPVQVVDSPYKLLGTVSDVQLFYQFGIFVCLGDGTHCEYSIHLCFTRILYIDLEGNFSHDF